tara:strand:+ start:360 stop:884 length:525 start_codon:yes stop_codon:yes gene_type:complete
MNELMAIKDIEQNILLLRGQRVMIGTDLAVLYGVKTKVLNQAVSRNRDRFPEDFMFQLTKEEKKEVVTNCDHLGRLKYTPYLPYAFTEHGAVMLANVLNSPMAVKASIQVVRAFVNLRKMLASNAVLAAKLIKLEKKYDKQFQVVFKAIYKLMETDSKKRKIGFKREKFTPLDK